MQKLLQNGEKIAIVGHSRTIYNFTAKSFTKNFKPVDSVWLKNCEQCVAEINLD